MPAAMYPALQSAVLLCIDDNEDVLECEKSFLESFGYSVFTPEMRSRRSSCQSGNRTARSPEAIQGRLAMTKRISDSEKNPLRSLPFSDKRRMRGAGSSAKA